jgi:hypothetical protein
MTDALMNFAETVAEQAHDDIAEKIEEGELPEGAIDSVAVHKKLVAMHIIHGFRSNGEDGDLDHDYIEIVARQASENAIAA